MILSAGTQFALANASQSAIDAALLGGAPGPLHGPRTEPGYVAAICLHAVPNMARAWRSILAPTGVSVAMRSVFCHASPQVKFKGAVRSASQCELADLLVVVEDCTSGDRRASLVQAKMASNAKTVKLQGPSSAVQLDLYQNWYPFTFMEAAYQLSEVDFNAGPQAGNSATFGIIDRHFKQPGTPPTWTQLSATPTPVSTLGAQSFAQFIVAMVAGSQGRDAPIGGSTDWCKAVDALMSITYKKLFHHRATLGPSAWPRGNTTVAFLSKGRDMQYACFVDGAVDDDGAPPTLISLPGDGDWGGISILRIVLGGE